MFILIVSQRNMFTARRSASAVFAVVVCLSVTLRYYIAYIEVPWRSILQQTWEWVKRSCIFERFARQIGDVAFSWSTARAAAQQ